MAQHDALTGVANRSLFNTQLEHAVKTSSDNRGAALILIDLDRFKNVNDVYGHQAGDIVIKETAARLKAIAGVNDSVARLGGDEFAIIQRNILFTNQAADTGHRIVNELSRPIQIDAKKSVMVGASVGIAISPEHAKDAESIFSRADIALYHSKNTGRNISNIYRVGLNKLMENEGLFRLALRGHSRMMSSNFIISRELMRKRSKLLPMKPLLRWNHPENGVISPGEFIPCCRGQWFDRRYRQMGLLQSLSRCGQRPDGKKAERQCKSAWLPATRLRQDHRTDPGNDGNQSVSNRA